jgi:hypothetical protein
MIIDANASNTYTPPITATVADRTAADFADTLSTTSNTAQTSSASMPKDTASPTPSAKLSIDQEARQRFASMIFTQNPIAGVCPFDPLRSTGLPVCPENQHLSDEIGKQLDILGWDTPTQEVSDLKNKANLLLFVGWQPMTMAELDHELAVDYATNDLISMNVDYLSDGTPGSDADYANPSYIKKMTDITQQQLAYGESTLGYKLNLRELGQYNGLSDEQIHDKIVELSKTYYGMDLIKAFNDAMPNKITIPHTTTLPANTLLGNSITPEAYDADKLADKLDKKMAKKETAKEGNGVSSDILVANILLQKNMAKTISLMKDDVIKVITAQPDSSVESEAKGMFEDFVKSDAWTKGIDGYPAHTLVPLTFGARLTGDVNVMTANNQTLQSQLFKEYNSMKGGELMNTPRFHNLGKMLETLGCFGGDKEFTEQTLAHQTQVFLKFQEMAATESQQYVDHDIIFDKDYYRLLTANDKPSPLFF